MGIEAFNASEPDESFEQVIAAQEAYANEFEAHGVDHVKVSYGKDDLQLR